MDFSLVVQSVWIAIHLVGLAAAWRARVSVGKRSQTVAQGSFLTCLPIVAILTVAGQYLCLATWPLSAGTLTAMVVLAVVDFGTDVPESHPSRS